MIKIHVGNMWDVWDQADLFLITANSYVKADGSLVMGAGIAKEAAERFPGVEKKLGPLVRQNCRSQGEYGVIISPDWPKKKLGIFQTKRHWQDDSDLDLIKKSAEKLAWMCRNRHVAEVHLNFPGVGCGNLEIDDVVPALLPLEDNDTFAPSPNNDSLEHFTVNLWMSLGAKNKLKYVKYGNFLMGAMAT